MNTNRLTLRSRWKLLLAAVAATGAAAAPSDTSPVTPTVVTIQGRQLPVYPSTLPAGFALPSQGTTQEGHEYLVARTAAGASTVVAVTVENGPLNLQYGAEKIGKGEQLQVNAGDFPTLAATGLHSAAELEQTTAITGKPVGEITRLGRPGMASGIGFLAQDEHILSVLQADNEIVRRLGLQHPDLARPLFHVWNLLLRQYELGKLGRFKDDVGSFWYHGREIHIRSQRTKGFQESIFNDEIKGAFDIELWLELDAGERDCLNAAYVHLSSVEREAMMGRLTRLRTGEMQPYYIMRYGFYEGHTEYRVDPIAIAVTFGLKPLTEIERAFPAELDRALTRQFTAKASRQGERGAVGRLPWKLISRTRERRHGFWILPRPNLGRWTSSSTTPRAGWPTPLLTRPAYSTRTCTSMARKLRAARGSFRRTRVRSASLASVVWSVAVGAEKSAYSHPGDHCWKSSVTRVR